MWRRFASGSSSRGSAPGLQPYGLCMQVREGLSPSNWICSEANVKSIQAWFARFKWALWVLLAALVSLGVFILRRMFAGTSAKDKERFQMPEVPPTVLKQVEKAEEQATIARIQAQTQAEDKHAELQQITQIPDGPTPTGGDGGAERRKRLATLLRTLN
jgi:hypothetical protein